MIARPSDNQKQQHFLDLPNPYTKVEDKPAPARASEHEAEPHHDWFHDACDWVSGSVDVAAQVVVGAAETVADAVTKHPGETLLHIAEGAAVGLGAMALAPLAAAVGAPVAVVGGIALAVDATFVGLTAAGVVHAVGDSVEAAGASGASADVLMHKADHSQTEINAAREDLQKKTGDAAVEVAVAGLMAYLTVPSAARVWTAGEQALGSGFNPTVITNGLAERGASIKAGVDKMLGRTNEPTTEARPGSKAEIQEPPLKVEGDAAVERLPAGSVPRFNTRLDEYLGERQKVVDVGELVERFQATTDRAEQFDLVNQYKAELDLRRLGLAKILNEHAAELYPDGTVPTLKVARLDGVGNGRAAYEGGTIYVRDADISEAHWGKSLDGSTRFVERLVHEMKHSEQDGLMIRSFIDEVIRGNKSGRELHPFEIKEIQELYGTQIGGDLPAERIAEINLKRAGRPLTAPEVVRAKALIDSHWSLNVRADAHTFARQRLADLTGSYEKVNTGQSVEILETGKFEQTFAGQKLSPELKALKAEYDQLPQVNGSPETTPEFVQRATKILEPALAREVQAATEEVANHTAEYLAWFHEVEAWAVGKQTRQFNGDEFPGNLDIEALHQRRGGLFR